MQIVEAGYAAPSAMNLRPVRFILLDKGAMAELAEKIEGQWAVAVCAVRPAVCAVMTRGGVQHASSCFYCTWQAPCCACMDKETSAHKAGLKISHSLCSEIQNTNGLWQDKNRDGKTLAKPLRERRD